MFVIPIKKPKQGSLIYMKNIDSCIILNKTNYFIYDVCMAYRGDGGINIYLALSAGGDITIDDTRWLENVSNDWLFLFSNDYYRFVSEDIILVIDCTRDKFLFWVDGFAILDEHFTSYGSDMFDKQYPYYRRVGDVLPCVKYEGGRCIPSLFSQANGGEIKTKKLTRMSYNEAVRYLI